MADLPRTVLCFGDSNTHGTRALRHLGDKRRFAPDIRWPGVMGRALGPGWQVIEEGHPGRTTTHDDPVEGAHKNGLTVLPALLETHRPLDMVVLMLGTNDLKARFGVPAFDIARSTARMAQLILGSDSGPQGNAPAVILVAPVAIEETGLLAEMFRGGAATSRGIARHLSEQAAALGVPFLDASTLAAVDPTDGIHLTQDGHTALGTAIANLVARA